MKHVREFIVASLVGGLLIVVPIYLSLLLLLKAMKAVSRLVRPFAALLPAWVPAEKTLSLMLVLLVCFLVGAAVRTPAGRKIRQGIEQSLFERLPGYSLFKSLTQQVAGSSEQNVWKPALVEMAGGVVLAFIIEEFDDGRFTVFVPSPPAPVSGSVYIMAPERVHPLDVPFTHAVRCVTRWGSGLKTLAEASASNNERVA